MMESREAWIKSQCSGSVLDIGSADGWVFRGSGLDVTSLDINEFPPGEFPRIIADAHNLPLDDGSFDCCVLAECLEHVNNPILVLKEAARVARKKVIFTVPDEYNWAPEHLPLRTIDDTVRKKQQSPEQLFKAGNPGCIKANDIKQAFHNRWYTKGMLESHLSYLGLPYQIQTIAYNGWSWFGGTINMEAKGEAAHDTKVPSMPSIYSVKYETLAQPRSLHIDIFPFCNAKCKFCRYQTLTKVRNKMDMKLLEHILDEAASWAEPLKEIVPVHYGEFFLDPDWYETLKLIETKLPQTEIVIPTNGSMLDQVAVEKLATIKTLFMVDFSVNAFFQETYQELMGLGPENIPKIKQAISQLNALRPSVKTWVSMVYSPNYQSEQEKDLFSEEWSHYTSIVSIQATRYCHDYFRPVIKSKMPCQTIFIDSVILSDGRVCPCCFDSDGIIIVGDVTQERILDIWHGARMNNLRQLHNSGRRDEMSLCSECTFS